MEEPVVSQGEKEGQTEVYLVFDIMLVGVGRWQGMPGLGSWPLLSRTEQRREAAGGRPLKMLESREGLVCVNKG